MPKEKPAPNPPTENVRGITATLFRDVSPYPVYLLPSGKFCVKLDGEWVTKTSAKAVDNAVAEHMRRDETRGNPRKIITLCIPSRNGPCKTFEAVKFITHSRVLTPQNTNVHIGYNSAILHEPELTAAFNELNDRRAAAQEAFDAEFEALLDRSRTVDKYNIAEVQGGMIPRTLAERRASDD